jgi:hypothetical protein
MKLNIATLAFCISACLLAGAASAARVGTGFGVDGLEENQAAVPAGAAPLARVGTGFGVDGEEENQAALPAGAAPLARVGTGFGIDGEEEPQATQAGPNLRASDPSPSLRERLSAEGLTLISDGLYAKHNESGENFVATNAAGRRALAAKVAAVRDTMAKRYAKNSASRRAQVLAKQSADIIADLNRPGAKSAQYDDHFGGCGNGSLLRARAISSDGNFADAFAANVLDFGPATPTDNFVSANTNYIYDMSSSIGTTPANASVLDYQSCDAQAYASATCPDGINGVVAYAYSVRPFNQYCEIDNPN